MDVIIFSGQSNMQGSTGEVCSLPPRKGVYEYKYFTDELVPLRSPVGEDIGENVLGQKSGKVCLGSGDFSLYIPQKSDYIYLFYSMITIDTESKKWLSCDVSFNAEGDPYVIKGNKFTVHTDDKAQDTGDVYCNDFTLE